MSHRIAAVAAALLIAATPAFAADRGRAPVRSGASADTAARAEAAPGVPHIVMLTALEGLPRDSVAALRFRRGFQAAFDRDYHLTESGGAARVAAALTSRFRLVQGDPWGDEWRLHVTVMDWWGVEGAPARADTGGAARRGPGCRVNVAVLSARAAELGARPRPLRVDIEFDSDAFAGEGGVFAAAGTAAGLLAVEALHRQSGDLEEGVRLRLPAVRRR